MIIAKKGMYLGQVSSFIQNLSSVKFNIDNLPIGMLDSVSGNDTIFRGGNCWQYVAGSYYSIDGLLTTDTVEVFGSSDIPTIPINGQLHLNNLGEKAYGVVLKRGALVIDIFPFCERVEDVNNHFSYGVINGTTAKLTFGSTAVNDGVQNEYFYKQLGFSSNRQFIPMLGVDFNISNPQGLVRIDIATQTNIEGECLSVVPSKVMYEELQPQLYPGAGYKFKLVTRLLYELSPNFFRVQLRLNNQDGQVIANFAPTHTTPGVVVYYEAEITSTYTQGIGDPLVLILASDGNYGEFKWYDFEISTPGIVPANINNNSIDALGNPIEIAQDGHSWLNDGSTMQNADTQELKDKDIYNVWYDAFGTPKDVTFAELETAIFTYPEIYGGDVIAGESIKNITLK